MNLIACLFFRICAFVVLVAATRIDSPNEWSSVALAMGAGILWFLANLGEAMWLATEEHHEQR
jgi:hypothetical protein